MLSAHGTNSPFIHVHWMFSNDIVPDPGRIALLHCWRNQDFRKYNR